MIVVSNSSPLISLAKIGAFDLLQKLYGRLIISTEVYAEVVGAGAGLAGAADVSKCPWSDVQEIRHPGALEQIRLRRLTLGLGELSAMILARELGADLILLSRDIASLGIYPAVDPLASTSRILDARIIGDDRYDTAQLHVAGQFTGIPASTSTGAGGIGTREGARLSGRNEVGLNAMD